MTVAMDYRRALADFDDFLADAAWEADMTTRNQSYTMVQGVFQVFRRRLTHEQAITFMQGLPPMLRALFAADWDPDEPLADDWHGPAMAKEVQALRRHHNFAPDTAIRDVATALRRHVEIEPFETCLARLPEPARAFWSPDPDGSRQALPRKPPD